MKIRMTLAMAIITITTGLLLISTAAFSELKPEDQITFRQSGMMFMRWNMGKIKTQVLKKPHTYNKEQVIGAANAIAAVANSNIFVLFNTESKNGKGWKKTRVKPEFFEQPEEVKKAAAVFKKEANQLARIAANGEPAAIKAQFKTLFDACKKCHKNFRAKD